MSDQIHKNDVGTEFVCTFKDNDVILPIDTATTRELIFKKPDGSILTKTPTLLTDGADGIAVYKSIVDDLDVVGRWSLQGRLVFATGTWHTTIAEFVVYDNLS